MQYQPRSKVLFLTICSLNKKDGGDAAYRAQGSVMSSLESETGKAFLARREQVRRMVTAERDLTWQGIPLADLPFNRSLKRGPDFGGDHTAFYMPALHRYDGRFFQSLGEEGRRRLIESGHHTIFLSGLYGLLGPEEMIQLYSCPLKAAVSAAWVCDDLLTRALCEYLTCHGIERVFDLTAMEAYRALVNWSEVAGFGVSALHVNHSMSAGDYALTPLGRLLGDSLLGMDEASLLAIQSEDTIGGHYTFREAATTLPGEPTEVADILERAREAMGESYSPEDVREVIKGGLPEKGRDGDSGLWDFSLTNGYRADQQKQAALLNRIESAIQEICQDPCTLRGDTVKPLQGRLKGLWRYRIGDYRLVYDPVADIHTVRLLAIAPRSSVYQYE